MNTVKRVGEGVLGDDQLAWQGMSVSSGEPVGVDSWSDDAFLANYQEHGYCVVRSMIPERLCDEVVAAYQTEIRSSEKLFDRIGVLEKEAHRFSAEGHVMNALEKVHRLEKEAFSGFTSALQDVIENRDLLGAHQRVVDAGQGEEALVPVPVSSFYFEVSNMTVPHADLSYTPEITSLCGSWVALEDIALAAGPLVVVSDSHRVWRRPPDEQSRRSPDFFAQTMAEVCEEGLEWQLLCVRKGDVVFFDGRTFHAAFPPRSQEATRYSLGLHFAPVSRNELVRFYSQCFRDGVPPVL